MMSKKVQEAQQAARIAGDRADRLEKALRKVEEYLLLVYPQLDTKSRSGLSLGTDGELSLLPITGYQGYPVMYDANGNPFPGQVVPLMHTSVNYVLLRQAAEEVQRVQKAERAAMLTASGQAALDQLRGYGTSEKKSTDEQ